MDASFLDSCFVPSHLIHTLSITPNHYSQSTISISSPSHFLRRCGPRLNDEARAALRNHFVTIRSERRVYEETYDTRSAVPITVRQLEAIVRIAEALAKMRLQPFATVGDVDEALRLFKVRDWCNDAVGIGNVMNNYAGRQA